MSGTKLDAGDVILVLYPFTDLQGAKRRPAVVLSRRGYNDNHDDVVACALTSNLNDVEHSVLLPARLAEGRLVKRSRVKVAKLFTAHRSVVVRRVGRIADADLARVQDELRVLLSL